MNGRVKPLVQLMPDIKRRGDIVTDDVGFLESFGDSIAQGMRCTHTSFCYSYTPITYLLIPICSIE